MEFYQRREIKDILAYLHLINNPSHDVALLRVINTPTRGIGDKTIKMLRDFADQRRIPLLEAARMAGLIPKLAARSAAKVAAFVAMYDRLCIKATATLDDLLNYLLEETDYQGYLKRTTAEDSDNNPIANVDELISSAVEFDQQYPEAGALELFLEQVALVSDTDVWEDTNDRVTVMTMHAAKGLEFPHVYIIAVEDKLLPHERSRENSAQLEEERRLLFVGITRAEKFLQLSYARRRTIRGSLRTAAPSEFLMELPRDAMRMAHMSDPAEFYSGSGQAPFSEAHDYPDSWDLADSSQSVFQDDEFCQLPDDERPAASQKNQIREINIPAGLKTATEMLTQSLNSPSAVNFFRLGMLVQHPAYGLGQIVDLTGKGPKRMAKVCFESGNTETFRLSHAPLTSAE